MSYILDALKKSDQERKQSEIPTLESVHTDLAASRRRRSAQRRRWLLLGAACLAVIAVGVGLRQWRSPQPPAPTAEKTAPAGQVAGEEKPAPPAPADSDAIVARQPAAPAPATEVATPVQEVAPPLQEAAAQRPVQVRRPSPPPPAERKVATAPETIRPAAPARAAQSSPPPAAERRAVTDDSPPLLKDLPAAVRKSIPPITMAGHVYSEVPSRRMIMINNRIVREGEPVGDQLKLLRITWDGVILRHMDTDFQIKL